MSRSSRAVSGFLTSLLQYGVQIALQVVLAPVVLKVAGRETLGAYAAVMQFLGYLTFVDFGFSTSLERFLAQSMGIKDGNQRFRDIFTTARSAFLASNTLFSVLTVIYSFYAGRLFHLSQPASHQAQMGLLVIAFWAILRTPLTAYNSALNATQDIAAANIIATVMNIARVATSLAMVLSGFGLFGLMISGSLVEGVGALAYRFRFRRKNPTRMPKWGIPDKALFREMLGFGVHAMFINVGTTLVYSSGNVLAGIVAGAAGASIFYTTQMPTMMGYGLALRLSDNTLPAINELWGQGQKKRVTEALMRVQRLTLLLTLPLAAGILLFNGDLVTAWVGKKQYAGEGMSAGLALFCLIIGIQHITALFSFVLGWVRFMSVSTLLEAIGNLVLGWLLGRQMGVAGITYAIVISITPATIYLMARLGHVLEFPALRLVLSSIARALPPTLLASGAGMLVHRAVSSGNRYGLLLAECATFSVVYSVSAYCLAMSEEDKKLVRRYLNGWRLVLASAAIEEMK